MVDITKIFSDRINKEMSDEMDLAFYNTLIATTGIFYEHDMHVFFKTVSFEHEQIKNKIIEAVKEETYDSEYVYYYKLLFNKRKKK